MRIKVRISAATLAVAALFTIAHAQERKITRDKLPPAVEKTVASESQGATIKGFATEVENRQRFYELSLSVNGHNKDILMDETGKIVEVEEEVSFESLPASVQAALKARAGSAKISVVESLTKNGTLVAYEAHLKRGLKRAEIQVGPNGEKLNEPE